jgi:RNA polymerase sigma factor (sigma-70 family)
MPGANHGAVLRDIDRIFNQGSITGLAEGQLLRQFATRGDEIAFETLVTRHGPMVLGVCRRLLYDPRDVEDAFQATFLALLRRAAALGAADPLGPWLHGVAYRVAARIRAKAARRPAGERQGARPEAVEPPCPLERREVRAILDEEMGQLPEKYRRPVVLCYLEGRTHDEAARRLGCTAGVLRGRLDRARQKLRDRLSRRGLAPEAGLFAATLGTELAPAAVPPALIAGTVATLGRAATAGAVATTVSTTVIELTDRVLRAMSLAKLELAASGLAAGATLLAVGVALLATLPQSFARDGGAKATPVAPRRDEADGSRPKVLRMIYEEEDEPEVNSVLHRGADVSGIVHGPDGSPLAGADVVLVSPSQPAFINNGRPPESLRHRAVKTGADGRFNLPPQEPPYTILVLHDRGFAQQTIAVRLSPTPDLTIQPWGRIEGTLRIGKHPWPDQALSLDYQRPGDPPKAIPWWGGQATTDVSGRFTFERVLPGTVLVARDVRFWRSGRFPAIYRSPSVPVAVSPAATARASLGGTGRPVVGEVVLPAAIAGRVDWIETSLFLIRKGPGLPASTRSGVRNAPRPAQRSYAVVLQGRERDRSFRLEDVEPGMYDLRIEVNGRPSDPQGLPSPNDLLGTARREVIVPAMPGGRSDEPLDLGTIALEPAKKS